MSTAKPQSRVEVVSIGTELLLGEITDTNAQFLGQLLRELGLLHTNRQTVGDNRERLVDALRLASSRADVVVTIGGLGPTADDITRTAIAEVAAVDLIHDHELEQDIRTKISGRGLAWSDAQLTQAQRPAESIVLHNSGGTAPGLIVPVGPKWIICLPGPRSEFIPMVANELKPWLAENLGRRPFVSTTLKLCGIGESIVCQRIHDLLEGANPTVATYAKPGEVHVRIASMSESASEAEEQVDCARIEISRRLAEYIYGADDDTLAQVVTKLVRKRNQTLATAESCTGGMLGARLTEIAGASDIYLGGLVCYSNELKGRLLKVRAETLERFGAVSSETAAEMAEGCRVLTRSDWALSVTGIAGPTGGSEEKPVGLVYIGCSGPDGLDVKEHRFIGSRHQVRERSVTAALCRLWNRVK